MAGKKSESRRCITHEERNYRREPGCQTCASTLDSWNEAGYLQTEERPPAVKQRIRQAAYEYHVRAFGEELARVNFEPLAKRRRYVAAMVDYALQSGVRFEKHALGSNAMSIPALIPDFDPAPRPNGA